MYIHRDVRQTLIQILLDEEQNSISDKLNHKLKPSVMMSRCGNACASMLAVLVESSADPMCVCRSEKKKLIRL